MIRFRKQLYTLLWQGYFGDRCVYYVYKREIEEQVRKSGTWRPEHWGRRT